MAQVAEQTAVATALPRGVAEAAHEPSGRGRWFREIGWRHVVGVLAVAFALFPVVFIISASINPTNTLQTQRIIPESPTLDHYSRLFTDEQVPFLRWLANSMIVSGITAAASVFLCVLAAYAFSRMRFRGRRVALISMLLIQLFPQTLGIVALFLLMQNIGRVFPSIGLGTMPGLILIYLGGALGVNTYLMKGFLDTIPAALDESARIDGAGHLAIFFRIILPLVVPVLAVVFLITFVFTLNDFAIASVILAPEPESHTVAVGLARFIQDAYGRRWGVFAAGAVLSAIPVVILFRFMQRYLVSGLTSGAVKG